MSYNSKPTSTNIAQNHIHTILLKYNISPKISRLSECAVYTAWVTHAEIPSVWSFDFFSLKKQLKLENKNYIPTTNLCFCHNTSNKNSRTSLHKKTTPATCTTYICRHCNAHLNVCSLLFAYPPSPSHTAKRIAAAKTNYIRRHKFAHCPHKPTKPTLYTI